MESYVKLQGLQDTVLSTSKKISVNSGTVDIKGIDSCPSSTGQEWEGQKAAPVSKVRP